MTDLHSKNPSYEGMIIKFTGQSDLNDDLSKHLRDDIEDWSPSKKTQHQLNEEIVYFPSNDGIYPPTEKGFADFFKAMRGLAIGTKSTKPAVQFVISFPSGTTRETALQELQNIANDLSQECDISHHPRVIVAHATKRAFDPLNKPRLLSDNLLSGGPLPSLGFHGHVFISLITPEGKVVNTRRFIQAANKVRQRYDQKLGYNPKKKFLFQRKARLLDSRRRGRKTASMRRLRLYKKYGISQ